MARLRAVVAVSVENRVQCQQPGCGHSVHAAIHVVEEYGRLLVLGSTCFAKRYGGIRALGQAEHGGAGGRKLTDEERLLLIQNTEALLAHFELQEFARAEAAALVLKQAQVEQSLRTHQGADKLQALNAADKERQAALASGADNRGLALPRRSPWIWQRDGTSVAVFTAPSGDHWVRVQHHDGSQKLVPWPQFPGWEFSLPAGVGVPDASLGVVAVGHIVEAIHVLQTNEFQGPVVGRWQDVLPPRSGR